MTTLYKYEPQEDLTLQELSDIMKTLFVSLIEAIQQHNATGADDLEVDILIYRALPDHLQRHFVERLVEDSPAKSD